MTTASSLATVRTPTAARLRPCTETRVPPERSRTTVRLVVCVPLRTVVRPPADSRAVAPLPSEPRVAAAPLSRLPVLLRGLAPSPDGLRSGVLRLRQLDAVRNWIGRHRPGDAGRRCRSKDKGENFHLILLMDFVDSPRTIRRPPARFPRPARIFLCEQMFILRGAWLDAREADLVSAPPTQSARRTEPDWLMRIEGTLGCALTPQPSTNSSKLRLGGASSFFFPPLAFLHRRACRPRQPDRRFVSYSGGCWRGGSGAAHEPDLAEP